VTVGQASRGAFDSERRQHVKLPEDVLALLRQQAETEG
jgi:hypothetical protein